MLQQVEFLSYYNKDKLQLYTTICVTYLTSFLPISHSSGNEIESHPIAIQRSQYSNRSGP